MVHPKVVEKGKPFSIKILFGDYGVRERPFFGHLTLYLKDPLGESYKLPLRRENSHFSTVIIPDIPGTYRLRCVGFYFGDMFCASGSFFVTSFFKRAKKGFFEEIPSKFIGVRSGKKGILFFYAPKVCEGGVWVVKGDNGKVILTREGTSEISFSPGREGNFLVVYSCDDKTFSYLCRGE